MNRFPQPERSLPGRCQAAPRRLELARPQDERSPDVEQALRHVATCAGCRHEIERRRQLDSQIAAVCGDVAVPNGLKERLLATLGPVESPVTTSVAAAKALSPSSAGTAGVRLHRRRLAACAAAAALLVMAGAGWLQWRAFASRHNLDDLTLRVLADEVTPATAPVAGPSDRAAPPLPATMLTQAIAGAGHRLPNTAATVFFFNVPAGHGAKIEARLLAVPVSRLANPPAATAFLGGLPAYSQGYCTTAWAEGEWAYVCCVKGGESELRRLRPATT